MWKGQEPRVHTSSHFDVFYTNKALTEGLVEQLINSVTQQLVLDMDSSHMPAPVFLL